MIIIRNRWIPVGSFTAINLFNVVFVKNRADLTPELLNHEQIHSAQQRELLFLPFYIIYCLEWLFRRISSCRNPADAYYRISFEREAYAHGNNPEYLRGRRLFAMWRK